MEENSDQKIFEKILQFSRLDEEKILEVGCGDGRITSLLADKTKKITAIDPDADSIKKAIQKKTGIDFRVGSGENLEFPDDQFDLIIFTLSLHHQNSRSALKEAHRVLKQNGAVLVIEPLKEGEVEKVCSIVQDETIEKEMAQKAIKDSAFLIKYSEIFDAQWRFEDIKDLYTWLSDYYQTTVDKRISRQIADILNGIPAEQILLQDAMIIQLLKKESTNI